LTVFDARTLERVAELKTDAYPHGLDISPDGRRVVATGFSGNHVRVFDVATSQEWARIEVGEGSAHTAFLPDGRTAFVGCSISDHLAVIDIETGERTGIIRLN
jgi:DNA-binding beta-propeller fold protein YncE